MNHIQFIIFLILMRATASGQVLYSSEMVCVLQIVTQQILIVHRFNGMVRENGAHTHAVQGNFWKHVVAL